MAEIMMQRLVAEGYTVKQSNNVTVFSKEKIVPLTDIVETDTNFMIVPEGSLKTIEFRRTKASVEVSSETVLRIGLVDGTMLSKITLNLKHFIKNQLKALTSFFQSLTTFIRCFLLPWPHY
mmetsp:Transcript_37804/g.48958  ORF Transcript_37804/g.48958 Transcript_37804/m.48958 type:complete len:121 (+) Transcript_37804:148-510(+)